MIEASAQLGEVSQFIRGITFKPHDVVDLGEPDSVACFRTKNVQVDLDLSDVWAVPRSFVKKDEKLTKEGDIILSTANSWNLVGKASWVPKLEWEATAGGFVSLLRADPERVFPRYLYHWIVTGRTQAALRGCARQTTNISNLSIAQAQELKIPLPPLEEQRRIAGILDQADTLRRLRTRAINKLNTLGQAIFHEMFGASSSDNGAWEKTNLSELVLPDDRINYGVVQPGPHDPEGVPIIRVADLASPVVDFESIKRIAPNIDAEYGRSRLKGGEVLIGCVGSIGTTVIAPPEFARANVARAVARVPLDANRCEPRFVAEQLRSQRVQNYFTKEVRLVAQPTLNIKQIRETEIILPPKEMQVSFVERVREIEVKKTQQAAALAACEALFASLQSSAFQGEV